MTLLQDLLKVTSDDMITDPTEKAKAEKNILERHCLIVGQHRATEYTHPHLNTDTEE